MKNCILFLTHKNDEFINFQVKKLIKDLYGHNAYDLWILYNSKKNIISNTNLCNVYVFNEDTVKNAGFEMHYYMGNNDDSFYGHNTELAYMSFYREHPEYDFYWLIEYDVYNTGNWYNLFSYYDNNHKDVDLYTTHINYGKEDKWKQNWQLYKQTYIKSFNVTNDNLCKCFNPIDRFSNKALNVLCDSYDKGDYGFCEVALPTILINNNLTLKAFGKTTEYNIDNRFVDDYSDNHFEYINDITLQFNHKYIYKNEMEEGKIYHPVKTFPI